MVEFKELEALNCSQTHESNENIKLPQNTKLSIISHDVVGAGGMKEEELAQ